MKNQPPKPPRINDDELVRLTAGVAAADSMAEEKLYARLLAPVTVAVRQFFRTDDVDAPDVIQETLAVTFRYIRDRGGFEGDLVGFAITVARNRCRNIANRRQRRPEAPLESLHDWVADPGLSPMDHLLDTEAVSLLRAGIRRLGELCRQVLRAFYLEEKTIEQIRVMTGLTTVQGVYYRRQVCVKELAEMLGSGEVPDEQTPDPR